MTDAAPDELLRVSIVEDNAYLRRAWRTALDGFDDMDVVADFDSVEAAAAAGKKLQRTDVLLLDIGLPGQSGIQGARQFSEEYPGMAIIMVTVHEDDQHVYDALCAGAVGYLTKRVDAAELADAIRVARAGGAPMAPNVARRVIDAFRRQAPPGPRGAEPDPDLTDKERKVLEHLARGESYASVGEALFLSLDGVRYHIRHIYQKLHVHSRSEAVAKGLERFLIRPPWA